MLMLITTTLRAAPTMTNNHRITNAGQHSDCLTTPTASCAERAPNHFNLMVPNKKRNRVLQKNDAKNQKKCPLLQEGDMSARKLIQNDTACADQ